MVVVAVAVAVAGSTERTRQRHGPRGGAETRETLRFLPLGFLRLLLLFFLLLVRQVAVGVGQRDVQRRSEHTAIRRVLVLHAEVVPETPADDLGGGPDRRPDLVPDRGTVLHRGQTGVDPLVSQHAVEHDGEVVQLHALAHHATLEELQLVPPVLFLHQPKHGPVLEKVPGGAVKDTCIGHRVVPDSQRAHVVHDRAAHAVVTGLRVLQTQARDAGGETRGVLARVDQVDPLRRVVAVPPEHLGETTPVGPQGYDRRVLHRAAPVAREEEHHQYVRHRFGLGDELIGEEEVDHADLSKRRLRRSHQRVEEKTPGAVRRVLQGLDRLLQLGVAPVPDHRVRPRGEEHEEHGDHAHERADKDVTQVVSSHVADGARAVRGVDAAGVRRLALRGVHQHHAHDAPHARG